MRLRKPLPPVATPVGGTEGTEARFRKENAWPFPSAIEFPVMARLRALKKFFALSWRHRMLLVETAIWLAVARVAILVVPFRWLAPRLGATMAESPMAEPRMGELGWRLGWALRVASRYTPWQTRCLVQAMAGKMLLKRRGIPSTLYLGLAKDPDGQLAAHAWLRCGGRTLTGGRVGRRYKVIAKFAEGGGQGPA